MLGCIYGNLTKSISRACVDEILHTKIPSLLHFTTEAGNYLMIPKKLSL